MSTRTRERSRSFSPATLTSDRTMSPQSASQRVRHDRVEVHERLRRAPCAWRTGSCRAWCRRGSRGGGCAPTPSLRGGVMPNASSACTRSIHGRNSGSSTRRRYSGSSRCTRKCSSVLWRTVGIGGDERAGLLGRPVPGEDRAELVVVEARVPVAGQRVLQVVRAHAAREVAVDGEAPARFRRRRAAARRDRRSRRGSCRCATRGS